MDDERELVVLLGGDYAGKSSVLSALAGEERHVVVSADAPFLPPAYASLGRLRELFLTDILGRADELYSPDYILSGLQMGLVYLRDRALRELSSRSVVVDSYYYKVLAKCALHGLASESIFSGWRSFRRPDRVLFLRLDPARAWERAIAAGGPARFEHYGARPTRDDFIHFQRDLEMLMLREVRRLPVHLVEGDAPLAEVVRTVREHLEDPRATLGRPHHGSA